MAVLVLAEHDNKTVRKATLNAVAAAQKLDAEIHLLVAGHNAADAAKAEPAGAQAEKPQTADPRLLAAWTTVARTLLNLDEFMTRE